MTEEEDRLTNSLYHCGYVLCFSQNVVIRCVAAFSPAAPVQGIDGKVLFELRQDWRPTPVIGRCAMHEEQRPSCSTSLKSDNRSVF
jgi:hypothetical protein